MKKPSKPAAPAPCSAVALAFTRLLLVGVVAAVSGVTWWYGSTVLFDRKSALRDALSCASSGLASHGVTTWIVNGTLLGAQRTGTFVMYDVDVDLAVLHEDGDRNLDEIVKDVALKCSAGKVEVTTSYPRQWKYCNLRSCLAIHEYVRSTNGRVRSIDGTTDANYLFPLQPCEVSGVKVNCPLDPSHFLREAFGHIWTTAPLAHLFW